MAALAGSSLAQTSGAAYCSSLQSSFFNTLFAAAPTTPAAILDAIATATGIPPLPTTIDPKAHQDQLCAIASALPQSLLPEFQEYAGAQLEFGREHEDEFFEFISACVPEPAAASSVSYLDHVFTATGNICTETETAAPTSTAAPAYPTPTGCSAKKFRA
ncbi:hypothetical protein F5B22DRAFT_651528 [Xylaria bambusicola]|uniref:uncharacterized protein n=1 Tax=Xylaria bambusicola TaxID=326684 RepID=UPI0020084EE8|nr:uncharacterized protein F5B22DRAFT_651528 [Xylaria bambusicola]KAI0505595.1 hypothetical protein F5B22DRAFT_651528 [Xylaria bambusicola]